MKLNNCNVNFGALFGKKEVTTYYNKDGSMKIETLQHVHPFKDEFATSEKTYHWLDDFRNSSYYKAQNRSNSNLKKEYSVVIEPELPFSEEVFKKAKKDGKQLIFNPDEFYSVVTKNVGYYPAFTFENGKFDCII